eukprot:TRINITY_DN3381_c0_g1_i4.p1 TRINITY_DN3381_c0_g1~~TRINITY_DN3381_c0_g1_i4.p1  ORF type:complete len:649 (+),score=179.15 TRINITY_DN3381_c0_g1_i4:22-1968(+)
MKRNAEDHFEGPNKKIRLNDNEYESFVKQMEEGSLAELSLLNASLFQSVKNTQQVLDSLNRSKVNSMGKYLLWHEYYDIIERSWQTLHKKLEVIWCQFPYSGEARARLEQLFSEAATLPSIYDCVLGADPVSSLQKHVSNMSAVVQHLATVLKKEEELWKKVHANPSEHQQAFSEDKNGMSQQHLLIQQYEMNHQKYLEELQRMFKESDGILKEHEDKLELQMEDIMCDLEDSLEREERNTHLLHLRVLMDEKKKQQEELEKASLEQEKEKEPAAVVEESSNNTAATAQDKMNILKTEFESFSAKLVAKQTQIDEIRNEKLNLQLRLYAMQSKDASKHTASDEEVMQYPVFISFHKKKEDIEQKMFNSWKAWENSVQKYQEEQIKRRQEIAQAKIVADNERREEEEKVIALEAKMKRTLSSKEALYYKNEQIKSVTPRPEVIGLLTSQQSSLTEQLQNLLKQQKDCEDHILSLQSEIDTRLRAAEGSGLREDLEKAVAECESLKQGFTEKSQAVEASQADQACAQNEHKLLTCKFFYHKNPKLVQEQCGVQTLESKETLVKELSREVESLRQSLVERKSQKIEEEWNAFHSDTQETESQKSGLGESEKLEKARSELRELEHQISWQRDRLAFLKTRTLESQQEHEGVN